MHAPTACDVPTCAVDGCGRPCHGRSALCSTHKARRLMHLPLGAPIRPYERDPERHVFNALDRWYDELVKRREALEAARERLDRLLVSKGDLARLCEAQVAMAESDVDDDEAWRLAQRRLRKALERYVQARTPKHKFAARRRR